MPVQKVGNHVANAFLSQLELIWLTSRLQISKMSKNCFFFGEKFQESMGKGILVANLATGFQNWVIDTRKLGALAYLCCAIFCAIF